MTEQEKFFFDHGYAQAKREFDKTIEDIKAEIELHHMNDLAYDEMSDFERGVLSIIDKHISGKER